MGQQLPLLSGESSFRKRLKDIDKFPLLALKPEILQLNITRKCNLSCKHCHVEAGPKRTEIMSREILEKCLFIIKDSSINTIDITGGAPEMNPHLEWFLGELSKFKKRVIIRTNLVILGDEKYKGFIDIYKKNRIEICASLPSYTEEKSDQQRGRGNFEASINVIKILNDAGYGKEGTNLILDIVHNPAGAVLPGSQSALEQEYKGQLFEKQGIVFNNLFCITNMPIGRYLKSLKDTDNYNDYMAELVNAFNLSTVDNVMCRTTLSVAWDGSLYDCDFNQMLCMPIKNFDIINMDLQELENREIIVDNHCFGCTAGSGSSCQGAFD